MELLIPKDTRLGSNLTFIQDTDSDYYICWDSTVRHGDGNGAEL